MVCAFQLRASWACLRQGKPAEAILSAYPYPEPADIDEALRYAASLAEDEILELAG